MKTLFLSLLFVFGGLTVGNHEISMPMNIDCDQVALDAYNLAIENGATEKQANQIYIATFWSCLDARGNSQLDLRFKLP